MAKRQGRVKSSGAQHVLATTKSTGRTMILAGLWEPRNPRSTIDVDSFGIFTTDANSVIATVHDRMPVIVGAENWGKWLGEEYRVPEKVDSEREDELPSAPGDAEHNDA